MKFMLGQKLKMTQVFDDTGKVIPATLVAAGPLQVSQVKTLARDRYEAVQFGYQVKKKLRKREARLGAPTDLKVGDRLDVSIFAPGDVVAVSGTSKGKGFQGVVKRHGFAGGSRTHGQKHSEREPGSIGGGLRSRVPKGMRMAGRTGGERVTVRHLKIAAVDKEKNELLIRGAVPGRRGTLLEIYGQ